MVMDQTIKDLRDHRFKQRSFSSSHLSIVGSHRLESLLLVYRNTKYWSYLVLNHTHVLWGYDWV